MGNRAWKFSQASDYDPCPHEWDELDVTIHTKLRDYQRSFPWCGKCGALGMEMGPPRDTGYRNPSTGFPSYAGWHND